MTYGASLSPGDALLYRGIDCFHWREPYLGSRLVQVFLHYVDRDGPHAGQKFDGRKTLMRPKERPMQLETKARMGDRLNGGWKTGRAMSTDFECSDQRTTPVRGRLVPYLCYTNSSTKRRSLVFSIMRCRVNPILR